MFTERFNRNVDAIPAKQSDVEKLENDFSIHLPSDYKEFVKLFGDVWTPGVLEVIVDNEVELIDIQQFWTIDQIRKDRKNARTSQPDMDMLPFASDSMGNIFGFLITDLKVPGNECPVYFFDHDFGTVEKISDSFTKLIERYNEL